VRAPVAAIVVVAGLLAGCQATPPVDSSALGEVEGSLAEAVASQPAAVATPAAVENELLPRFRIETGEGEAAPEQRFDISVQGAPAQEFFMGLVKGTPYNMVVHPDVGGSITLELKRVTIPEVMDIVRDVYGYEYQRGPGGFRVLPARLRTRIFEVDYLNVVRSGSSETRVSSGQITSTARDGGTDGSGDSTSTTSGSSRSTSVTGTRIKTRQPETSFWSELDTSIRAILGDAPGRAVVVNPQSGVVVVRAMPGELREVERFLRTTQVIAERQVILEAKILEVVLDDGYQQGIDWRALFKVDGKSVTAGQAGPASLVSGVRGVLTDQNLQLSAGEVASLAGAAASGLGGVFAAAIAFSDFNALITLLDQQGTVHVLSSPRVSTLNNQKAVIKVGSDEFFVTDVSSTTTTGTATTTTPSIELTPFFSGVALDVTPQISADGEVLLHVHPTISEVQDQEKTVTLGGATQVLPLAQSSVRESDTMVRARSGQIVVIGGLMQNRYERTRSDSPLSAVPLLGAAFSQQRERTRKTELVILIKPVVVSGGAEWSELLRGSAGRVEAIGERMRRLDEVGRPPAAGAGDVP